jgi:hypothetical protein
MIQIGTIIKDHCKRNNVQIPTLAAQINETSQGLYKKLRKNDMAVSTLHAISQALNHNFFIYFIPGSGSTAEHLLKLSNTNKALTSKVANLQKEVLYLQEINALLKIKGNN